MLCPRCNTPIDEDTVFCGNCGNQVAPLNARGATVVETTEKLPEHKQSNGHDRSFASQSPQVEVPTQRPWSYVPPPIRLDQGNFSSLPPRSDQGTLSPPPIASATPYPPRPPRSFNIRQAMFIAFILVLLAVGITAGTLALLRINANNTASKLPTPVAAAPAGASGLVTFSDSQNGQGHSNALKIIINGLKPPASGSQYHAWLVNEQTEQTLPLGTLTAQGQAFTLDFKGDGTNLLGAGDKIEITQEQGDVQLPTTGTLVLTGKFPALAFIHIRHLLFSFPSTPGKVGLLVGTRDTARHLNEQALLLRNAANNGNPAAIRCAAQSIVNLAEGNQGPHAQALPGVCSVLNITAVGDGFGLLGNGYIALAQGHASLAATQPDATQNIKTHAGHVEICMDNVKGWVTTIDQDARALLTNPNDMAKVQEIVTLTDHTLNGVDTNGDESVDPVPGEGGAITSYVHGQLMAALPLTPQ